MEKMSSIYRNGVIMAMIVAYDKSDGSKTTGSRK